jgi:hypothetical protein
VANQIIAAIPSVEGAGLLDRSSDIDLPPGIWSKTQFLIAMVSTPYNHSNCTSIF